MNWDPNIFGDKEKQGQDKVIAVSLIIWPNLLTCYVTYYAVCKSVFINVCNSIIFLVTFRLIPTKKLHNYV